MVTDLQIKKKLLFIGFFLGVIASAYAHDSFFTISGEVKDQSNKKKLQYVAIAVTGTNISTVTNEDGEFSLKIPDSIDVSEIIFSCMGYFSLRLPISRQDELNKTFLLVPNPRILKEIIIQSWSNPSQLIKEALSRVETNYSEQPSLSTCFYRETIKKGRNYIDIAEAIINVYKTEYSQNIVYDRVQLFKGRRLLSPKKSDTLSVKLLGGPTLAVHLDFVKDADILFDPGLLFHYKFEMQPFAVLDNRVQYVVKFEPQVIVSYPLFYGIVYIDQATLTFTRAEFSLDMHNRDKVTNLILHKKPRGLRFRPEEVSFLVTYTQKGDKSCLHYIRNKLKFKCDWKRRLFATNYEVVSEMVATDIQDENIENIPGKEAFKMKDALSDKLKDFGDVDFWGAYNIIEPTESLESAVGKLMKQQEKK